MCLVVPVHAVLCVDLGVLADVLDVRRGFRGGWGTDDIWATGRGGECAAYGGSEPAAGDSAVHADIGCFGGHGGGHLDGRVSVSSSLGTFRVEGILPLS